MELRHLWVMDNMMPSLREQIADGTEPLHVHELQKIWLKNMQLTPAKGSCRGAESHWLLCKFCDMAEDGGKYEGVYICQLEGLYKF